MSSIKPLLFSNTSSHSSTKKVKDRLGQARVSPLPLSDTFLSLLHFSKINSLTLSFQVSTLFLFLLFRFHSSAFNLTRVSPLLLCLSL